MIDSIHVLNWHPTPMFVKKVEATILNKRRRPFFII